MTKIKINAKIPINWTYEDFKSALAPLGYTVIFWEKSKEYEVTIHISENVNQVQVDSVISIIKQDILENLFLGEIV